MVGETEDISERTKPNSRAGKASTSTSPLPLNLQNREILKVALPEQIRSQKEQSQQH